MSHYTGMAKQPSLALGRALAIYSEIRCANPKLPEIKQWRLFLAAIADDAEMLAAVEKSMVPPQPPRRDAKVEKTFHDRLAHWAEKHGVIAIERKVRNALEAGHYGTANRLRNEALALMRQGSGQVHRALVAASS
jgi:hypothetical protein